MAKVPPIPEGYTTLTPYLICDDAKKAIEFYKKAFNATELFRMEDPQGRIGHAEMQIGNARMMMADEHPEMGHMSPKTLKGTPVSFMVYVEDVDMIGKQAVAAGMTVVKPIEDQFYGDRTGTFKDPFGHVWSIGTCKEILTPEEMKKRADAMYGKK